MPENTSLVDQARAEAAWIGGIFVSEQVHASKGMQIATLLRQLADRVQELEGKPESAGWQCRAKSMDPLDADDPWGRWKEVAPWGLDAWRRRVERDPDRYELREVFARAIEAAPGITPSPSMVGREGE